MKKIALVNQRYGLEVNGGSEYYTRLIAERLTEWFEVDVITTKAIDYTTWANHYDADEEVINGVNVKRFPVSDERAKDFGMYNGYYLNYLKTNGSNIGKEEKWFEKQGPHAPAVIAYIREHKEDYDVFIFVTYLYYLTVKGMPEVADKAIFIPTAHEEPYIHFKTYETLFQLPQAYVFLTEEERELVQGLFQCTHIPYEVMGVGVDIPCMPNIEQFRKKRNITDDYVIYVGRIDESKGCPTMFQYFIEYKKRHPASTLKLILMGKQICDIPKHQDIINLGFVSEEEKFSGIAGAKALLLPSEFESLSISVLEALTLSVPVVVNGKCEVLKGHCKRSNAGLYYQDYFEFEGILEYMFVHDDEYNIMCRNGKKYVQTYFEWHVIMEKFKQLIDNVAKKDNV